MNLKNAIARILFIVFAADPLASQDAPEKELTQSLSSKVTEVTIYAERARGKRESSPSNTSCSTPATIREEAPS